MVTVYKVVSCIDKRKLRSAIRRQHMGKHLAQLVYAKGKTTVPKFGKIFAFASYASARYFALGWQIYRCQVWEAEAPSAKKVSHIAPDGGGTGTTSRFKRFWLGLVINYTMEAPTGTVVCPEVTLIKRRL